MPNFLGAVEKATEPTNLQEFVRNGIPLAVVVGHLGRDPEHRDTADGKELAKFSVAVSWGKRGSQDQRTEWIYCVAWEREARIMERFGKGDAILVMGKPSVRLYKDKEYAELRVYSIAAPIYKDDQDCSKSQCIGNDSKPSSEPGDIPF